MHPPARCTLWSRPLASGLTSARVVSSCRSVTMPCILQSLTFRLRLDLSLYDVALPCSLRILTLGDCFHQKFGDLGHGFLQRLHRVVLPSSLAYSLTRAFTLSCCRVA